MKVSPVRIFEFNIEGLFFRTTRRKHQAFDPVAVRMASGRQEDDQGAAVSRPPSDPR
jgi:hypothetical protein